MNISMNRVILLLLGLAVLNNSVLACIPAVAIKYIVKHRLEHFNDDIDITEPVRIAKEALEDYFNADKNPSFRIRTRQNDATETENPTPEETLATTEKPKTDEPTVKPSNVSTEKPKTDEPTVKPSNVSTETATTSTFKPGTLDDPNFIPGDFVDQHGNPKVIVPPPVTTVLQDFLAEIEKRYNRFLWTGANFLISLSTQVLVLIGFATVLCTYVPFFYMTKGMNSHRLPKSIRWLWEKTERDNIKIAKRLAQNKIKIEEVKIEEATETEKAKPNQISVKTIPGPIPITVSKPSASEVTASESTVAESEEEAEAEEAGEEEAGEEEAEEEQSEEEEPEAEEAEEEEAEEEEAGEEEAAEEEEEAEEEPEAEETEEEEGEEEEPEAEEAEEVEEEEAEEEEAEEEEAAAESAASK